MAGQHGNSAKENKNSQIYNPPILLAGDGTTITVKAYATFEGMLDSNIVTETYTISDINNSTVSTPSMSPVGGTYNFDQSVSSTCATGGATIYYTTDGFDPDTGSTPYTVPISVAGDGTNMTIKVAVYTSGDNGFISTG